MALMAGRRAFLDILRAAGVQYIFGNPGTTELPLMDILVDYPDLQYILTLHEGVAMAMADGYALASGRLGVVNVHVAPGLGNAMGMLYDATKTASPLLVTAGQQDGRYALTEPILWGDMVRMATPLTKWAYQVERVQDLPRALRRAIKVATTPPTGPVFLALPMDIMMAEADLDVSPPPQIAPRIRGDLAALERAAALLSQAHQPLILAGDEVAKSDALAELVAVAELLGARVFAETVPNTTNFPSDHPLYQGALVRSQEAVRRTLQEADVVFAVGADMFTMSLYSDVEPLPPTVQVICLHPDAWEIGKNYPVAVAILGDPKATLAELLPLLQARLTPQAQQAARQRLEVLRRAKAEALERLYEQAREEASRQPMSPLVMNHTIATTVPEEVVIVDESITSGAGLRDFLPRRHARDYFGLKGGGIGWGLPATMGVALALPQRPVLGLIGDGSAMYSIQGLWTAARYGLRCIFVICNNRQYLILKRRLHAYGGPAAKAQQYIGIDLAPPSIQFVALAQALGVPAERVERPADLQRALKEALQRQGPTLLDVPLEAEFPVTA
ncbi:MAG: benzoylformate decarboxylase [Candidatus Tectimicrobiota bacterium]|nr:MAG: benzoylformate decarboxylase [Candidatus Tectomicrobia bacterium]